MLLVRSEVILFYDERVQCCSLANEGGTQAEGALEDYWCAQAMCGMAKPVFRLPYVPLSYEQRVEGAKLLRAVAEHLPGVTDIKVLDDDDFILIGRH